MRTACAPLDGTLGSRSPARRTPSSTPLRCSRSPALGEHTREFLAEELGLLPGAITQLAVAGVIEEVVTT